MFACVFVCRVLLQVSRKFLEAEAQLGKAETRADLASACVLHSCLVLVLVLVLLLCTACAVLCSLRRVKELELGVQAAQNNVRSFQQRQLEVPPARPRPPLPCASRVFVSRVAELAFAVFARERSLTAKRRSSVSASWPRRAAPRQAVDGANASPKHHTAPCSQ